MKMILISLLLAVTSQSGYKLDEERSAAFDKRYLRLFPIAEFKDPTTNDELLASKVRGFLSDVFGVAPNAKGSLDNINGVEPKVKDDLHEVLVFYINLNAENMRKVIDKKRLDIGKFVEIFNEKAEKREKFLLDFFENYEQILINILHGVVALAFSKGPNEQIANEFVNLVVKAVKDSYIAITETEAQLKAKESRPDYAAFSDWRQRMYGLESYTQYRYNTASTVLSVISKIDLKLQTSEVSEEQEAQLLARCAKLVETMTKSAKNDLPLLKNSFADLLELLREQRWASGIADASHRYMRWNAKLLAQIIAAGKGDKSLYKIVVNAARRVALGPGLVELSGNQKVTQLLSQILKQTNIIPAFGGPSTLANMKRLFFIDVLAHSPQNSESVVFSSPVCQARDMDEILKNFAELIEVSPKVLETRSIGSLFTQFPEGLEFFNSLGDQGILAYLHTQLNAVYAFRVSEAESLTSLDAASVGQKFDLFLDNHREDPELNLEKYYPLIKVVNGYTNLAPSKIPMEQKPFSEAAKQFLIERLETLEFVPIRKGILAVFALNGPVYQRHLDSLEYLNKFQDVSFNSVVLLKDTPIAEEYIAPVVTEKPRKNIVKVKAGSVPDEIISLLEKTPNAIESFRNPAITAGLDKNFEYTFGWVTRWDSPCKEEK